MDKKLSFIISGGGTGGHIFPALSIANELKNRFPEARFLFVGAEDRMEMEVVPKNGFEIVGLPVKGFIRKPTLKNITVLVNLLKSIFKARKIIKSNSPDVVIGVGGYASGPVLRAAAKSGIPTVLQEQNGYAGVTNKLLAKTAKKICVAYDNMERFFPKGKIILTGNPIRKTLLSISKDTSKAKLQLGFKSDMPLVLIVGGSLGARTLNNAMLAAKAQIGISKVQFLWQTGKYYYDSIQETLGDTTPENVKVVKFIDEMDVAYAGADLIISRAGAGTISELCIVSKPVILVPSPNVAEDHQTKNAMALVDKDAAVLVKDKDAENLLVSTTLDLLNNESKLSELSKNIHALAKPNATEHIVDEIVALLNE